MKKCVFVLFFLAMPAQAAWFDGRPTTFADLAERVKPAVVNISTTKTIHRNPMQMSPSPFGGPDPFEEFRRFFGDSAPQEQKQQALGTGFIINEKGDILTNNHVVGDADEIQVHLADGRKFKAEVVGRDERTDLAVIKIDTKSKLPFVKLGDSDVARPGDWVMAVGNPFGFEHTVTVGVVSAKGRILGDEKAPFARFIQTDASINPGNSGGPLFNLDGEVIGINTMIYGMGTGIGFAIPSNLAKSLIPQLQTHGKVTRGWLGVQIQRMSEELAKSYELDSEKGALIASVFPDSPAEKGGLKQGDVVLKFDDQEIKEPFDLSAFVAQAAVGTKVKLLVLRDGKRGTLTVKIGKLEEEKMAQASEGSAIQGKADILGLTVRGLRAEEAEQIGTNQGVLVERIEPGSPGEGTEIHEGDLILEVNQTKVNTLKDYNNIVKQLKKGSVVRLFLARGGLKLFIAFNI